MSYLGKTYTVERHEKFDEFLTTFGVDKVHVDAINSQTATEKLEKNGDTYTFTLSDRVVTFKSGVEFEEDLNGVTAKTTFVVDGDSITQTQKFPDGRSTTFKKKFSGNKLVVEATHSGWDGVAYRYYTA